MIGTRVPGSKVRSNSLLDAQGLGHTGCPSLPDTQRASLCLQHSTPHVSQAYRIFWSCLGRSFSLCLLKHERVRFANIATN